MSVKLDSTRATFVRKMKLVLTVATLVARNAKQATVGSGGVCVWRECGGWSQAISFVLVRLVGIWLQSPRRLFHV
jgi:hypothetical protein